MDAPAGLITDRLDVSGTDTTGGFGRPACTRGRVSFTENQHTVSVTTNPLRNLMPIAFAMNQPHSRQAGLRRTGIRRKEALKAS